MKMENELTNSITLNMGWSTSTFDIMQICAAILRIEKKKKKKKQRSVLNENVKWIDLIR